MPSWLTCQRRRHRMHSSSPQSTSHFDQIIFLVLSPYPFYTFLFKYFQQELSFFLFYNFFFSSNSTKKPPQTHFYTSFSYFTWFFHYCKYRKRTRSLVIQCSVYLSPIHFCNVCTMIWHWQGKMVSVFCCVFCPVSSSLHQITTKTSIHRHSFLFINQHKYTQCNKSCFSRFISIFLLHFIFRPNIWLKNKINSSLPFCIRFIRYIKQA